MNEHEIEMLEAYVGNDSVEYYKKVFGELDTGKKWSWNWSAFFFGFSFAIYRNNSLAALVFFILPILSALFAVVLGGLIAILGFVLQGGFMNWFLYIRYKKLKTKLEKKYEDKEKRIASMKKSSRKLPIFAFMSLQIYLALIFFSFVSILSFISK